MPPSWQTGFVGAQRILARRLRRLSIEESAEIPVELGIGTVTRIGQTNFRIDIGSQVRYVKQRISGKTPIGKVLQQQIEEVIQIVSIEARLPRTRQLGLPIVA
jgi:hypothetical protein